MHKKCAKLVDEKYDQLFSCLSVRDFEPKIFIKDVHLINFEKNCLIESWFFLMKKGIHSVYIKKIPKKVYITILLFILYSIGVHEENPKYKMVCLKSPNSSDFAICF